MHRENEKTNTSPPPMCLDRDRGSETAEKVGGGGSTALTYLGGLCFLSNVGREERVGAEGNPPISSAA